MNSWKTWLKSLGASAISGGAGAVVAAAGSAIASAPLNPRQLVASFVSAAIVGVALYLKQSPLPGVNADKPQ